MIVELRAENEGLRAEGESEAEASVPGFVKPNKHKDKRERPKKTRRQRAAEQNAHAARKKEPAAQVTEIREHALECSPDCHYKLRGRSIAGRRQVIDLPVMPALRVVEHGVIKRWSPACKSWHVPKLDLSSEVLGQGRMGHGIASKVSWLRTTLRLPVKMVQRQLDQI